ncbi:transmembrane protein, putative [Bodo saltans]|uniref:Transmembrane protein, putative n=1 Tax=Bodo saltans TaxID=75058 RepID=A0A0S4JCX1_BODSA|nr:transmembrane protein, putative [Bodo saltans]|eukprot:CUG87997.1 transmembrane protein, putative [Bodo saltans]
MLGVERKRSGDTNSALSSTRRPHSQTVIVTIASEPPPTSSRQQLAQQQGSSSLSGERTTSSSSGGQKQQHDQQQQQQKLQQQLQHQQRQQLARIPNNITLQDFVPVLLETDDATPARDTFSWLFPEFGPTEAEDEFSIFNQFRRVTTFFVVLACFIVYLPATIARMTEDHGSCRGAACIIGLVSQILWIWCVVVLGYLLRQHIKYTRLFEYNKKHIRSVGNRVQQATSPEAFANHTLDTVLPVAAAGQVGTSVATTAIAPSSVTEVESSAIPNTSMPGVPPLLGSGGGVGPTATATAPPSAFLISELRRSSITLDMEGPQSPTIAQSTITVAMDERQKYLALARQRMRLHATWHEIACGCALVGFFGHGLAFLAERENCTLGISHLSLQAQRESCTHTVQLEASFLIGALLSATGLIPVRMPLVISIFSVATAFLLLSWWYLRPRVAEDITSASHGVLAVACSAAVITAMWRAFKRERHMRVAFKKLCDIQTNIAQLAILRQHTGSLVGPAIPPDIAKIVATRQELFDYSGDAAVLCVGIRDLSIVASDSSCSEITDFLQRWFLVLDSIKLCFPRCFKIHCFGDRYMVVAGWEQYLPNEEKEKMTAATIAETQRAIDGNNGAASKNAHQQLREMIGPEESSMFLEQPTLMVSPPPAPILLVQQPSSEFSPDQPASNPALKAKWNTECVYSFGLVLARILQPEFFERLWCTVRGVYWTPGATPRSRDESQMVSVAISADIGRAAGVLLAGTTLSYVAVGDAVSRCQRLVNNAPSSGFFVSHEFQRCLGFAVDPYICTVMPDETQKSAIERELESSLGVNLWNAPVLQSIGESMDDNGASVVVAAGDDPHHHQQHVTPARRKIASATSPQDEGVFLANSGRSQNPNMPVRTVNSLTIHQQQQLQQHKKRSLGGSNSPADDFVSPLPSPSLRNPLVPQQNTPGGTHIPPPSPQQQQQLQYQQTLIHSSSNPLQNTSSGTTLLHSSSSRSQTSQQILELIHKELEVNPFSIEGDIFDLYRLTNDESEKQYITWVERATAKRREEFVTWFLLCVVCSLVYLASTLIYGASLVPIPSPASLFLLSAIIAVFGILFTLLWYPSMLDDWMLLCIGVVHHVAVMAGFFQAVAQDDATLAASSSRAVLLWLLTHVIMARLPAPATSHILVDLALDALWSVPFVVVSGVAFANTTDGVDRMPNAYIATHVIAELFVCSLLLFARARSEEAKRNTYAISMRLKDLNESYRKDVSDLRKLLERLVHNKDVVDELLPAFVQQQQQQQLQQSRRRSSKGSKGSGSAVGGGRSARDTILLGVSSHNPLASSQATRSGGGLIGSVRETSFLICTMAFNGNTPMPKRSSRRAQAMNQMKPILKPMWKFFGQLEEVLTNNPECAGATVVKTNGDMILFTPKTERSGGGSGGDANDDANVDNNANSGNMEPRSSRIIGSVSMLELALALYHLGASVSGVEMRLVLSFGPLAGAILGSCALSLEYYGSSAFIAYELTQRALPRVVATDTFIRTAPAEVSKSEKWSLGSPQNERIQQYGFVRVVPVVFKQAPTLDGSRRSTTTGTALPRWQ